MVAIVTIEAPSSSVIKSRRDVTINFSGKLAAIGGTLGLFSGMSILSMVEIVYWLMKIPTSFFTAITKKKEKPLRIGERKTLY